MGPAYSARLTLVGALLQGNRAVDLEGVDQDPPRDQAREDDRRAGRPAPQPEWKPGPDDPDLRHGWVRPDPDTDRENGRGEDRRQDDARVGRDAVLRTLDGLLADRLDPLL